MTLYQMWTTLISIPGFKTALVIVLLSIVEVCPVKINPWSWIGGLIGRLVGIKALSDKVDALNKKSDEQQKQVNELANRIDENQATTIRVRILRFEDELQDRKHHSKDSWDQCMDDIRRYEEYTSNHPEFKNEITIASVNHIRKQYAERLERRDWDR